MSSTAINGATYAAQGFFSRLTPILNTVKGLRDQGKKIKTEVPEQEVI